MYAYTRRDVHWDPVSKTGRGKFHSGCTCFSIELQCARRDCKVPATVHIEKSGATEAEVEKLLLNGFFVGDLSCGHSVLPPPKGRYRIQRVMFLS